MITICVEPRCLADHAFIARLPTFCNRDFKWVDRDGWWCFHYRAPMKARKVVFEPIAHSVWSLEDDGRLYFIGTDNLYKAKAKRFVSKHSARRSETNSNQGVARLRFYRLGFPVQNPDLYDEFHHLICVMKAAVVVDDTPAPNQVFRKQVTAADRLFLTFYSDVDAVKFMMLKPDSMMVL